MTTRLPTGIKQLDLIIGGFPRGSIVSIKGPSGSGKPILVDQLAYQSARNGSAVAYITFDDSPDGIKFNMNQFGWAVEEFERRSTLIFFDAFSHLYGGSKEGIELKNMTYLNVEVEKLLTDISSRHPDKPLMIIINSLTTAIVLFGFDEVVKYIPEWRTRTRKTHAVLLMVHSSDTLSPTQSGLLDHLADVIIELKRRETEIQVEYLIRVLKMRYSRYENCNWRSYRITEEGFTIEPIIEALTRRTGILQQFSPSLVADRSVTYESPDKRSCEQIQAYKSL